MFRQLSNQEIARLTIEFETKMVNEGSDAEFIIASTQAYQESLLQLQEKIEEHRRKKECQ